jgi:hypothetical protein
MCRTKGQHVLYASPDTFPARLLDTLRTAMYHS